MTRFKKSQTLGLNELGPKTKITGHGSDLI